jgi:hypothetical protein
MINPLKSRSVGLTASLWRQWDPSLHGTLWVVIACLGTLATLFLPG